ncbi:Succinyl-CoA synthetase, alpha subunit-related enzyme [Enhygromyxa salina]|uniref:Succinyl-CoA synthetase, alpha subunit-related enzyme n=1 Tax=Enhygromyxa salina TaxID=215803 RepID=A0A0C2DGR7_9BACT|nr:CoA-binding protein [Enhygromyxa salina]KIG18862.1 Succinyl-CoA synthetase, alpha subunit-related enzyme [Enhygromyxa salina]
MSVVGEVDSVARVREILTQARTIAVLGASLKPERPAFYVPDYLHAVGYQIIPVNPLHVGESRWGAPFEPNLAGLQRPIDIVDVFRHPRALPQHLADLLGMQPRPRVVWFQLGIRNDEVAAQLIAAGIEVVQDRCTLAEHRQM